ncbi:MAG: biotin/lipoyl-binding protein [Wenzhouxiangella sp.]|nr:biotin/lipoyl-binding protein [Wenzhouxiangella sp.]
MPHSNEKIDRLRIRDDDSQAETRYWPWAAGLVALVLAAGVCVWWWSSPGLAEVRVVEPRQVSTNSQAPRSSVLDASGYVIVRRRATVSAKVTGKIEEVLVEEGMEVEAGQVLERLDDALARTRLQSAASAVREFEDSLSDARRTLNRRSELCQRDLASQSDVDEAGTLVERYEALLQVAAISVRASAPSSTWARWK